MPLERSLCSNLPDIMDSLRVTIVGGGAAAVIAARHLLSTTTDLDLRIVEKDDGIGPGLAYRTTHALHTLNNFAGRLSAVPGDPDHLLRWCARRGVPADPRSFLPRRLYGTYLAEILTDIDVPAGSSLTLSQGQVTDLLPTDHGHTVVTSDGRRIESDVVVLALGNPPPRRRPDLEILRERYVADPWAPGLDERAAEAEAVLLIGTGLTMVDVAASLHDDHPQLTFTAVSRTLLVPQRHRRSTLHPHDAFHPGTSSLDELVAAVDGRIAEVADVGGDWRDVVDAVRGYANELWQGLSAQDQQRFATGLSRRWDTHRHRMAPEMAAYIDGDARGRVPRARSRGLGRPDDVRPRRQLLRARAGAARRAGTRSSTGSWRAGCSPPTRSVSGSTSTTPGGPVTPTAPSARASTCWARRARDSSGRSPRSPTSGPRRWRSPTTSRPRGSRRRSSRASRPDRAAVGQGWSRPSRRRRRHRPTVVGMGMHHGSETFHIEGEGIVGQQAGGRSGEAPDPVTESAEATAAAPRALAADEAPPFRFSRVGPKGTAIGPALTKKVARAMIGGGGGDGDVPAGYTYLGQFIDHDLTFDRTKNVVLGDDITPAELVQGRSPRLDLDSLYGVGPANPGSAKFYAPDGLHLKVGDSKRDLPRREEDRPRPAAHRRRAHGRSSPTRATTRTSSSPRPTCR